MDVAILVSFCNLTYLFITNVFKSNVDMVAPLSNLSGYKFNRRLREIWMPKQNKDYIIKI